MALPCRESCLGCGLPLGGVGEVLATILPRLGDVLGCEFMEPVFFPLLHSEI